jgi:hypothetical protein
MEQSYDAHMVEVFFGYTFAFISALFVIIGWLGGRIASGISEDVKEMKTSMLDLNQSLRTELTTLDRRVTRVEEHVPERRKG